MNAPSGRLLVRSAAVLAKNSNWLSGLKVRPMEPAFESLPLMVAPSKLPTLRPV